MSNQPLDFASLYKGEKKANKKLLLVVLVIVVFLLFMLFFVIVKNENRRNEIVNFAMALPIIRKFTGERCCGGIA